MKADLNEQQVVQQSRLIQSDNKVNYNMKAN